ncbi:RNA polymerase sigma factor [Pelagicoccus mobilis]|uniref:RNA polymerase sigma factor n=1 Tax=Pelagicoccus mobilis TaxID=415221 RepID=A0A934VP52_9BACT|nr:sigma-70 family RNA polymerase sigma factor [Pelagicoccus mobilis]MBK1880626.1 sigma-70 family RNA polymerase sigma factor [Pelagicoccus mobilis]
MKLFKSRTTYQEDDDASLVLASLGGDRDAFGKIVTRYQGLLCSLAYSSLGDLAASEDVAQDAFVEAWKKLGALKDPEKLKSWLCGILRFKVSHYRRSEARRPIGGAVELDDMRELESEEARTEDVTMKEEEQALLWQALEKVPENYREPLVLYYREHRSIEHVAYELDLSEDAVKQRLSRGRKMLQEKMMTFVEEALAKSTPGGVFTAGVLAAMATIAPPAKAAGAGAAAVQVGSWFKWATIASFLASVSGLISTMFALRANFDQSRTKRERRYIVKSVVCYLGSFVLLIAALLGMRYLAIHEYGNPGYYAVVSQGLVAVFALGYSIMTWRQMKGMQRLRMAERARRPDLFTADVDQVGSKKRSYKSKWSFLGVPLVHVKFNITDEGDGPAFGWIAGGEKAYGLLIAWGGITVAPVCVGIISFGIVSIAAVSFGIFSMGAIGIGFIAMGSCAIGYKAYSTLSSTGWESAFSQSFSVAKEAAIGHVAFANEVNSEKAGQIMSLGTVDDVYGIVLGVTALMVIAPVVWYAKEVRKRMAK